MEGLPKPSTVSNLYERLGLPVEATQEEIVAALKVLGPIWDDPWLKFEKEYRAIQEKKESSSFDSGQNIQISNSNVRRKLILSNIIHVLAKPSLQLL